MIDDPTPRSSRPSAPSTGRSPQAIRELVDAAIRTTAPEDEVRRAQAEIEAVTARLRAAELTGPYGVRFRHRRPQPGLGQRGGRGSATRSPRR